MPRALLASSPTRERRVNDINARYRAQIEPGYPVTLEGNAETLQVARDGDAINWLIVQGLYQKAASAGGGDLPGQAFLQTTSNNRYYMTPNEALAIIDGMTAWGLAAWDNWNRLKGAARDPEQTRTAADLEALNLDEGWP